MRVCFLIIFLFSVKILLSQSSDVSTSNDIQEQVSHLLEKGKQFQKEEQYQDAVLTFETAAQLLEHSPTNDDQLLAKCYKKIAINYFYLELYDQVKTISLKGIHQSKKAEAKDILVWNYALLGDTYFLQGQFDKALSYFDSCLQIDTYLKDTVGLANDLIAIGRVNTKIGREQEGIQQLKESIALINLKQDEHYTQCLALNALGLGYSNAKDFENAEKYILKSLEVAKEIKDTNLIINRYINLGDIHTKAGAIDKAEQYLLKSLSFMNTAFQSQRYSIIYRNLGDVYRQKQQYQKAIQYNQKALKIAERKNMLPEILIIYQHLQKTYKAQNQYAKALNYAEQAQIISDSIFSIKARNRADLFNNKFASAEKEKAIQTLHHTNELKQRDLEQLRIQRTWLFVTILLGFLLSAVSFYAYRQRQQKTLAIKQSKINNQLDEIVQLRNDIKAVLEEKEQHFLDASLTFEEINQLIAEPLSQREFEVLQLLIKGHNNKEIAAELFLSINTIKFHLKNIYSKLDVKNRLEVIQLALRK